VLEQEREGGGVDAEGLPAELHPGASKVSEHQASHVLGPGCERGKGHPSVREVSGQALAETSFCRKGGQGFAE
jgi:hypothetical protein